MAYSKQTWDTNSIFNPTRMNHIEDGIESASTATGTEYSSGVSVKDKIDNIISKYENVSVTTSASGAFIIPNNINYTRVLNIVCTSRVNTVILLRGADNYCFAYDLVNGVLTPLASTSLLVTFTYY